MAEFKTLSLDKILVPERLRAVEEDHAFMISQSITRIGLLNPITVRATPRAGRPYTIVAGAHRLRACELAGLRDVDAIVVKADKLDGQMVEIEENIFRNELTALDRAIFVQRYREIWEEKNGWDKGGRPASETSANFAEVSGDSAQAHFFQRVSERMGLSRRAVEYAQFIGKSLSPDLRAKLRGTPDADNQSRLLQLARLEAKKQQQVAAAVSKGHDLKQALRLTDDTAKAKTRASPQDIIFDRMVATWGRADEKTKAKFLEQIGASLKTPRTKLPTPSELIAEAADGVNQITIFEAIEASK
jgi:ParB family transcriptional regulator, chromosome partitioning protein